MENMVPAVELVAVSWEQFVGAVMRRAHGQRLLATARPRRRQTLPKAAQNRRQRSLLWMLAISFAGFWLLRS